MVDRGKWSAWHADEPQEKRSMQLRWTRFSLKLARGAKRQAGIIWKQFFTLSEKDFTHVFRDPKRQLLMCLGFSQLCRLCSSALRWRMRSRIPKLLGSRITANDPHPRRSSKSLLQWIVCNIQRSIDESREIETAFKKGIVKSPVFFQANFNSDLLHKTQHKHPSDRSDAFWTQIKPIHDQLMSITCSGLPTGACWMKSNKNPIKSKRNQECLPIHGIERQRRTLCLVLMALVLV